MKSIEARIQKAQKEIEKESEFDLSIINNNLDLAKKESLRYQLKNFLLNEQKYRIIFWNF